MDDVKHGIYLPYLTDLYNAMVFKGMVLPDEKADLIRRSLLGEMKATQKREGLWGGGFFGGRRQGQRRSRGAGVSHQVEMVSHEEKRSEGEKGITEADLSLELKGKDANAEYSERITIPEGVLVTGFWLEVNGTNKPAQIRERKAATWVYEMIRDITRRDPGLVVYEDDQHLRLKVYPFASGETRRCGLRFRFPSALQPSIQFGDKTIRLVEPQAQPPSAVSGVLPGGGQAMAVPARILATWPSFRREVVAHLIVDQSAHAKTNRDAVASRVKAALESLPASINRVRFTWANFEQEDLPGEPVSRDEAMLMLNRFPSLPFQGGFCPERVIKRILLAENRTTRNPQTAGFASLFIVIPAPGSSPLTTGDLAPFARLAPDLPLYRIFDNQGFKRVPFGPDMTPTLFPTRLWWSKTATTPPWRRRMTINYFSHPPPQPNPGKSGTREWGNLKK
jgi:hypothetical protein